MAYWPCLLDRLIDDKPHQSVESEADRRISREGYIAIVIRDLRAVLNASSLPQQLVSSRHFSHQHRTADLLGLKFGVEAASEISPGVVVPKLRQFPLLESSTLNYGFYDLNGASIGNLAINRLEKFILGAIQKFEPRLKNVQVFARKPETAKTEGERQQIERQLSQSILSFEIRCKIDIEGIAQDLRIRSEIDLKTGHWSAAC